MSQKGNGRQDGSSTDKVVDPRFANFETDPRFRLPSRRKTKTTIDKRFSRMLRDEEFTATSRVDRYGRKIRSDSKKKALRRLYQEEGEEDVEVDDDEEVEKELRRADTNYDPARGGGFSSSESDSDDEDEEDEDVDVDTREEGTEGVRQSGDRQDVATGEITNRLAIVNLDWDHIKSPDLMALFSGFTGKDGRIERISIYPSEFGKDRMQREELEGPPKEIFRKPEEDEDSSEDGKEDKDGDEDSDEEVRKDLLKEGDDQDFDSDALRTYQLDRLRYFYAVMVCSDKATAERIYKETDGTEYQASSNVIDLRFVPDDVGFDEEPRDTCDTVPTSHQPIEFVTHALQHSKVKLTWDLHPEEASRSAAVKRAFGGSRSDIAENDLRAYLASDSEGDDDNAAVVAVHPRAPQQRPDAGAPEDEPKLGKKELARRKMREALGLAVDSAAAPAKRTDAKGAPVGDMQVTFTAALTDGPRKGKKGAIAAEQQETTLEKYVRKEKERKARKKGQTVAKREGRDPDAEPSSGEDEKGGREKEDLGFDDPFFTAAKVSSKPTASARRKEERRKKREAREQEDKAAEAERKQLSLLMADDLEGGGGGGSGADARKVAHFDMAEILRAEKLAVKKAKGKKVKKGRGEGTERGGLQQGFAMEVADPRFAAVFEDHEFAIDPSNPRFKSTEGMRSILEEGRRKRRKGHDGEPEERKKQKVGRK